MMYNYNIIEYNRMSFVIQLRQKNGLGLTQKSIDTNMYIR